MNPSEPLPTGDDAAFIRLHPSSLVFALIATLRQFLIPGIIVLLRGGENFEIWLMLLAIPAFLLALFRYLTFRFRLAERDMIVRKGLIFRSERIIPYARIQNLDYKRNLFHRMFGVCDMLVQTASGKEPEATLSVLRLKDAEAVRDQVARRKAALTDQAVTFDAPPVEEADRVTDESAITESATQEAAERRLAHAGIKELALFGLITNRGWLAVAALIGLAFQFDLWPDPDLFEAWADRAFGVSNFDARGKIIASVVGLFAVVVIVRFLSVIWAILTLYDFSLLQYGDELRTRFGLLTQHALTLPKHRIQLIDMQSSPTSRLFKRVTLRARTAGALNDANQGTSRDWLMPIYRRATAVDLLREVQPEIEQEPTDWLPISPRGARRMMKMLTIFDLIIVTPMAFVLSHWWWFALVPALGFSWLWARWAVRSYGYALTSNAIWFRHGVIAKSVRVIRYNKIQTVTVAASPFDRRNTHASVKIDTANSGLGQFAIAIPYLSSEDAERLRRALTDEAERRDFIW